MNARSRRLAAAILYGVCLAMMPALAQTDPHSGYGIDSRERTSAQSPAPQPAPEGGLYRCTGEGLVPLPALALDINLDVTGILLRATIVEEFTNPTDQVIEALYVFPLPERAAVDTLEMQIGERRITSIVQEKEEAQATYAAAKAEGRKAALLAQRRPNLFQVSVTGINPGEKVLVRVETLEEVPFQDGEFRIAFPLTFTPRYSSGRAAAASGRDTDPVPVGEFEPPRATLEVRLDAGMPIEGVRSTSHSLTVTEEGPVVVARADDGGYGPATDRDFLLQYRPVRGREPGAAIVAEDRADGAYALLMLVPPALDDPGQAGLSTDTLFIVDVSGSMEGPSIRQARAALVEALDRLRPGDGFNLLKFSDVNEPFEAGLQPAGEDQVEQARRWVRSLEASGGTEIVAALVRGLEMMRSADPSRPRRIILITDGAVDDEEEAFFEVAARIGDVRLHVLGIGSAPNRHLLRKLAGFGRGACEFIPSPEQVKERMTRFLERIDRPVLTDVRLDWDGAPPVEAFPGRIPDLYAGDPLFVSLRLGLGHPGTRAVLTGRSSSGPFRAQLDVSPSAPVGSGIATRWARAKVESLMDALHEGASETDVRACVVETAKEFHLVTKYTSLVAVEERVTAEGTPVSVRVANQLPCKVLGELPQAGTSGPLLLRLGALLIVAGGLLATLAWRLQR